MTLEQLKAAKLIETTITGYQEQKKSIETFIEYASTNRTDPLFFIEAGRRAAYVDKERLLKFMAMEIEHINYAIIDLEIELSEL